MLKDGKKAMKEKKVKGKKEREIKNGKGKKKRNKRDGIQKERPDFAYVREKLINTNFKRIRPGYLRRNLGEKRSTFKFQKRAGGLCTVLVQLPIIIPQSHSQI